MLFVLLLITGLFASTIEFRKEVFVEGQVLKLGDVLSEKDQARFNPFLELELSRLGKPGTVRSFHANTLCKMGLYPALRKANYELPECVNDVKAERIGAEIAQESISKELEEYLKANLNPKDSNSWEWHSEWKPLVVPKGDYSIEYQWPPQEKLRGPVRVLLQVFEKEVLIVQRRITLIIRYWVKAPYSTEQLQRGVDINPDDLEWEWTDLTRELRPSPDRKLIQNSQARRTIASEQRIRWSDLQKKVLVQKGEQISVCSRKMGASIVVKAIAQEKGGFDDLVRAINSESGKKIQGRLDEGGILWVD